MMIMPGYNVSLSHVTSKNFESIICENELSLYLSLNRRVKTLPRERYFTYEGELHNENSLLCTVL